MQTNVTAFGGGNGSLLWDKKPDWCWGNAAMAVGANGVVYSSSSCDQMNDDDLRTRLFALNTTDGSMLWAIDSIAPSSQYSAQFQYAVIGGGSTLLVGYNGTVQCYK